MVISDCDLSETDQEHDEILDGRESVRETDVV